MEDTDKEESEGGGERGGDLFLHRLFLPSFNA